MEKLKSYNVQIWIGLREQYSDKIHSLNDVRIICDEFVNDIKDCLTITPTEFRYVGGGEIGVIIGYIQYPRFKRSRKEILKRSLLLANLLMIGLNQIRVTVTTPYRSYMLENKHLK